MLAYGHTHIHRLHTLSSTKRFLHHCYPLRSRLCLFIYLWLINGYRNTLFLLFCVFFPPSSCRCVCPHGSSGPRCKVLARSFFGNGWAWVRPLPPCLPTTLSLRVLTRRPDALLLYSGPLAPHPRRPHHPPTPMLALQLVEGRPEVLVEGVGGPLRLVVNTTVHDGDWHSIHLHVHSKVRASKVTLGHSDEAGENTTINSTIVLVYY